jgi:integrase
VASVWIERRRVSDGSTRFRVRYRLGGSESIPKYGGSFRAKRDAQRRSAWVMGELAAMRVPDLKALAEPERAPTVREVAARWVESRKDVREATTLQHRTSLNHVNRLLGDRPCDAIGREDVQRMIDTLASEDRARESIRKARTALSMVLDFASVAPNPARDDRVKLPLAEPDEVEPPHADHVEAVGWLLAPDYLLALLVLDATGARVGELAAATIGDLDENRRGWLLRAKVAKTRRARTVELPDDLFRAVVDRLPAREDRDPLAPLFPIGTTDRLRMAIGRACRDAAVPVFSPHDLRHRRISLWNDHDDNGNRPGLSWPEIGKRVGQRNIATTADTYSHVIMDYREIDRPELLRRVRIAHPSMHTPEAENGSFAGAF